MASWDEPGTVVSDPIITTPEATMATSAIPTITVLGTLADGSKLVKPEWAEKGVTAQLSTRQISAIEALGINVTDNPDNYLF